MHTNYDNNIGRPKIEIDKQALINLRDELGSWPAVASFLGVSHVTIYRRIKEFNIKTMYYVN